MFVTMLCTGTINLLIDRIGYSLLRRAPRLAALITAVGMSLMLENPGMIWKGPSQINYPNIFPTIDILNDALGMKTAVLLTTKDLFLLGVTVPLMIILSLFIRS